MTTLRRFMVLQLHLLWQGGFLFYTSAVVPTGTQLLGATGQGAITARVTDKLNVLGAVALAVFAIDLLFARDPSKRRTVSRWVVWSFVLGCQVTLFYLHLRLESYMDDERRVVMVLPPFYPTHRVYLWTSTVQWVACLGLMWWTLRSWRTEDQADPKS